MPDQVGNPEDRFSQNEAHLKVGKFRTSASMKIENLAIALNYLSPNAEYLSSESCKKQEKMCLWMS